MTLLESLKTGTGKTLNGCVTNTSTLNNCLDFFFQAGACREWNDKQVIQLFKKAYNEDRKTALKILFWSRDVRGGAGERKLFRTIFKQLDDNDIQQLIEFVPKYGRWDDLFYDLEIYKKTSKFVLSYISKIGDSANDQLLFKWLPREGQSNKVVAKSLMKDLGLTPKQYRKMLSGNSKTVEQQMSKREWEEIKYSVVPSKAFKIYRNSFAKHSPTRFNSFLSEVENGKETIKAGAIYPVEIYQAMKRDLQSKALDLQWKALPNLLGADNILPVCDVSGSMDGIPKDVSISLGLYLSERTQGKFKDHFISFCGQPELHHLVGSLSDKINQIENGSRDMNTNIMGVFELILNVALRDRLPQSELPDALLIISDMEFDSCNGARAMGQIRDMFKRVNYEMPKLVFWNVSGRTNNFPVLKEDLNVALISGYSPNIMKTALQGTTPMETMMKTLEKYNFIDEQ